MKQDESLFTTGDLVAVFGGEIGKEGKRAEEISICKVVVVGEKDLIVYFHNHRFIKSTHHTVPKNICCKLFMDPDLLVTEDIMKPVIGDLVLSFSRDNYKDESSKQTTGILYKITYQLGKPHKCSILCGSEMKEVQYSNLMVLQSKIKS